MKTNDDVKEAKDEAEEVNGWLKEMDAAASREEDYLKAGKDIVELYEGQRKATAPYNILYANTETLAPALFNSTPRPDVRRRFAEETPVNGMAAQVLNRILSFLIDNDIEGYQSFDTTIEQNVLQALVPGRGIPWVKYESDIVELPLPEDAPPDAVPEERLRFELVCTEKVDWDKFRTGYALTWSEVPWISRDHYMTRQDLLDNFPKEIALKVKLEYSGASGNDKEGTSKEKDEDVNTALVHEIWDKDSKRVLFVSPGYDAGYLKQTPDTYKLTNFYPCPEPLQFFDKISTRVPTPLYALYEEQAVELNEITARIMALIKMCKVRGMFNSTLANIKQVLEAEDGHLEPIDDVEQFMSGSGSVNLDDHIWLMPLDKIITVITQLYQERERCKAVIHEITGIADVMRGSTKASETLGAQELKASYGGLRLSRMQRKVQFHARNLLRIMGELSVSLMSLNTIKNITQFELPTNEERERVRATLEQLKLSQQPQPVDPELIKLAESPSWEEVLEALNDDLQRAYLIDIETNSTLDAQANDDKADMGELLNALAQFFNGIAPMLESGIMTFDAAKSMMLAVTRKYRLGHELEDEIKNLEAPGQAQGLMEEGVPPPEPVDPMAEVKAQEAAMAMEDLARSREISKAEHDLKLKDIADKALLAAEKHQTAMMQDALRKKQLQAKLIGGE